MEMKERLWRKLSIEVSVDQNNNEIHRRRTVSNNLLCCKIQGIHSNDDKSEQINSPTFQKIRKGKFDGVESQQENFSFCGHMIQEIGNLLLEAYENEENKCVECVSQQVDSFVSNHQPKKIAKIVFNGVLIKIVNFVKYVKHMVEEIKLNIKKYQKFYGQQKRQWENGIESIIGQINGRYGKEIGKLEQKMVELSRQNYYNLEMYRLLQKKQVGMKQQVDQLLDEINKQKKINEKLNRKFLQLNQQYQNKIKENSNLLQQNYRLKQQSDKLIEINNWKTKKNNYKNYSKQNQQNQETPEKQSFTQYDNMKNNIIVSAKTTLPPHTHKDFLSDFTQSITFCQEKNQDIFINNGKQFNNYINISQELKQNEKLCANYTNNSLIKCSISRKSILRKKLTHENQTKLRRMNSSTLSGPLKILTNDHYYKQKITVVEDKNTIIDRIKKLKKQICLEIQDLRMDNN